MKREFLKNLGITDEEVINKILDENSNDRTNTIIEIIIYTWYNNIAYVIIA